MSSIDYTPPPTVKNFIMHYRPQELFCDWIVGPVGSGKTTGVFFKLAYMAQLQAKSPKDGIRRSRCVIVRNTNPQLQDTTIRSWSYWFKDGQAGTWKATTKDFLLKFGDVECEVMFRPLDTPDDVNRVLSLEVTFAIIDEFVQIPKAIIEALSGRCGRYPPKIEGGATNWGMWGASNPGNESNWWYAKLEDHESLPEGEEPAENWTYFKQPSGFSEDAENLDNLPGGKEYYTNLAKGKSDHWIKMYIEVQWGYDLNGKPVFPMFNRELHISKRPMNPLKSTQLVIGYDPGMSGSAAILGQVDLHGRLLIYDEIVLEDVGTERFCMEYLKPLLKKKYQTYDVIVAPDPAANNRSSTDGKSSVDVLKRQGFAVSGETENAITPRLESMQHFMMRLTAHGPALQIDPSCVRLIRALQGGYKYTVAKDDTKKEIPDKNQHSHVADAGCYLSQYFKKGIEKAGRRAQSNIPRKTYGNSYVAK